MRKIEEIIKNPLISNVVVVNEKYGVRKAIVNFPKRNMHVIFGTNEEEYEHVSVSMRDTKQWNLGKLPTWQEMCIVKSIFWDDEEEVYQIHPKKSEYVNVAEALHLWRRIDGKGI